MVEEQGWPESLSHNVKVNISGRGDLDMFDDVGYQLLLERSSTKEWWLTFYSFLGRSVAI